MPVILVIGLIVGAIAVFDIVALRYGVDSRDLDPNARDLRTNI